MKGEILFEKMTHISDEYIAEAALIPGIRRPKREWPDNAFTRFMASGWAVAMICALVSLSAVVAMVYWGQMGDPTIPGSTNSDFSFSYQFTDGSLHTERAHHLPGESFTLHTEIVNHGSPFTYEGSSSDFCAYAQFVLQGNGEITLDGAMKVTADIGTFHVEKGDVGHGNFIFQIPANATPGTYDLVLSYGREEKVFEGILIIEEPENETKPETTPSQGNFSFGFDPYVESSSFGIMIRVWVQNNGDAFTYTGSSTGFFPSAVLRYAGDDATYSTSGWVDVTNDYVTVTIAPGQIGEQKLAFDMAWNTYPSGYYDLELSFGGETKIFKNAIHLPGNIVYKNAQ